MSEEEIKETTEEVEEESSSEPSEDEKEEESEPSLEARIAEMDSKNKQLYARLKKQEEQMEAVRQSKGLNVEAVAEFNIATNGLSADEVKKLVEESKVRNKPLSEIRKSEDFDYWLKGHREKVAKETVPPPSTKQGGEGRQKPIGEMSIEEAEEFFASLDNPVFKMDVGPRFGERKNKS
jgi:hypothetical protein